MTRSQIQAAAAALLSLVAACSTGESKESGAASKFNADAAAAAAPQQVAIRARDYAFDAPDTIFSGPTTLRLTNAGPEMHHVWLVRLDGGHTLEDAQRAMAAGGPPPEWIVNVGGPNAPGGPGAESVATLDLKPGNYVLLCWIPSPDGVPHVMKGMTRPMVVVPAVGTPASMPRADLTMELGDYYFKFSAPVTAGTHTIRIENAAEQPHEVVIVKLAPGKTAMEMVNFVHKPEGTPPGQLVGGVTGISKGGFNQITATFEPGEYALICFVPDARDGKPHVAHGMTQQFTVS